MSDGQSDSVTECVTGPDIERLAPLLLFILQFLIMFILLLLLPLFAVKLVYFLCFRFNEEKYPAILFLTVFHSDFNPV